MNVQQGWLTNENRTVRNVMSQSLTVASPQTSLQEATDLMRNLEVPVIVVYDGTHLAGLLSERDAMSHLSQERPQDVALSSVMRTNVPCCLDDDRLSDAITLMRAADADWLPVLDHRRHLVGILSRHMST